MNNGQPYTVKIDNSYSPPKITLEPVQDAHKYPNAFLCLWKGQPLDLPGVYCPPFEIVNSLPDACDFFKERLPDGKRNTLYIRAVDDVGAVVQVKIGDEMFGWVVGLGS